MLYSQCNIFDIFLNIFVRRQTILLGIGWWVSGREGCGSLLTTDLSDDCTQLPSGSVPTRFWLTKIIILKKSQCMKATLQLLTASEVAARNLFSQISKAIALRKKNAS